MKKHVPPYALPIYVKHLQILILNIDELVSAFSRHGHVSCW